MNLRGTGSEPPQTDQAKNPAPIGTLLTMKLDPNRKKDNLWAR